MFIEIICMSIEYSMKYLPELSIYLFNIEPRITCISVKCSILIIDLFVKYSMKYLPKSSVYLLNNQ